MQSIRNSSQWSGTLVFLLAAVGYAIGLGNIWRFAYVVGVNGGGGFVLIYLLCVAFVALPVLICDLVIGRRGGGSPPTSIRTVAAESGVSHYWSLVGWLGLIAAVIVLSYYCVIAGWTLIYSTLGVTGNVANDAQSAAEFWQSLMASPRKLFIGHSIFIILVATVSAFGLKRGLEKCTKIAMPLFLATLLSLVGYGAIFGDFSAGFRFLFEPRFDEISIQVFVIAMGQALWSLGVGASVLMVYGAYLPPDINIRNSAIIIAIADAGVAILGGLAIFSLVFASGMNPADGPGLIFQTLPVALAEAPGGAIASTAFFVLLLVAGFTSAIGIMELVVAWAEEHMGTQRLRAVIYTTLFAWILGIVTVLSFNEWSGFYPLSFLTIFEQSTIFDVMDFTVASIVMPIAAVVVCIFAGWKVREDIVLDELGIGRVIWYRVWRILVRWVIPILLTILMVAMIAS